jgi:hypothetical protein
LTRRADPAIVARVPEGMRPLGRRAWWAIGTLAAVMVADVVVIWSDLLEIQLMNRLHENGELYTALTDRAFEDVEANDDRQLVVIGAWAAAWIVAVFFFIRWFWSAYSNLRVLGQPHTRFHPAWAIVSWFVPIFNLWRPKQMANDIWRGSRPDAPAIASDDWKDVPAPALLACWWGAWLVSSSLSNYGGRLWWNADTVESVRTAAKVDVAATSLEFVTAVLAIAVIRKLTAAQLERAGGIGTFEREPLSGYDTNGVHGELGQPG